MTEIRISKQCLVLEGFGHWIFEFEFYLKFGAWNLYFLEQYSKAEPSISNSRNAGQAWPIEDPALRERTRFFKTE